MIDGSSRVFAILGNPVSHSLSPAMHNAAFRALGLNAVYVPFQCGAADVPHFMRLLTQAGGGGNVTVPYKESAAATISHPSDLVKSLGACNTFWQADGGAAGDNTDVAGLLAALEALEAPATAWYVAGTGGGARAAVAAARLKGAAIAVRSREPARRQSFERWVTGYGVPTVGAAECEVLINSTPLGLAQGDHLPIAIDEAPRALVALDMVYARTETVWVRAMRQSGLRAADGRAMLVAQGAAAFRHWFPDEAPPTEIMRAVVNDVLR